MYVACLISCDKLVSTCMELILLHFLSFPNNFNVFYAISPAPLCREETPLQSFVFGESKHLKNQSHWPVHQLWSRASLVCSSSRQPPSEINQRQVIRASSAQSSARYVLFHQGQFVVLELLKVIPAHLEREDSWKEQDCTVWATSQGTRN